MNISVGRKDTWHAKKLEALVGIFQKTVVFKMALKILVKGKMFNQ